MMPQQSTIIPLTDEEISALANDPEAVKKFTSDERRRMSKIKPPSSQRRPQSEPDTYMGGVMTSVSDTVSRTAGGIGRGVLDAVNPMNYLQAATGPMRAVQDPGWAAQQGQNIIDMVRQLIQGNPETGGQMIGSLATALAAPHIAANLPAGAGGSLGARTPTPIRSGLRATGAEVQAAPGAGMTAKIVGRVLQAIPEPKTFNDLPLAQQMEHLPTSGPVPETTRIGGPPALEPQPRNVPSGGPQPRLAGKAPTLQDALIVALEKAREPNPTSTRLQTPNGNAQAGADSMRILADREAARAAPPPQSQAVGRISQDRVPSVNQSLDDALRQLLSKAKPAAGEAGSFGDEGAASDTMRMLAAREARRAEAAAANANPSAPASAPTKNAAAPQQSSTPAGPARPPSGRGAKPESFRLTPDEVRAKADLVQQGYPEQEVVRALLSERLRRMSPAVGQMPDARQMAADIAHRNATGKWE